MERIEWLRKSVDNVADAVLLDVTKFDEARLTKEQLADAIRDTIHFALTGTYDVGFNDGLGAQDEEEDSIELDLDVLRKIKEDDDDRDQDEEE